MEPHPLVDLVRASVIGDDEAVEGPYGIRRVTYADYTASGRSLSFIEDYLREAVLPPLCQHAHGVVGHRAADDALPRGRTSAGPGGRRRQREGARRRLLRVRLDRRHQPDGGCARPAHPRGVGRPLGPSFTHPRRPAPGGVHRAVRAPQQRAALARDRSRMSSRSARTTTGTSTWTSCGRSSSGTQTGPSRSAPSPPPRT